MKILVCFSLLFVSFSANSAERLTTANIDVNALTEEGQLTLGGNNTMDLAWWMPIEFWEASLGANPDFQSKMVLDTLRPYSVVAIVQANISDFGAFTFYGEDAISKNLLVEHFDENGKRRVISHTEEASPDVVLLLNQMVPVLAAAMGNMGENFYFFPLPDLIDEDNRLVSPYEKGMLRVTLGAREGVEKTVLNFELPFNSLHVPRQCPNGKPAHVSWGYCPWSGKKLD